jgi:transcriptional regulator with XRE-family HTH domain
MRKPLSYYRKLFKKYPNVSLRRLSEITEIPFTTLRYNKKKVEKKIKDNKEKWREIFRKYPDKRSKEIAQILGCSRTTVEEWAKKVHHELPKVQKKYNWELIFEEMPPSKFSFSYIAKKLNADKENIIKQGNKLFPNWKKEFHKYVLIYTYLTKNQTHKQALEDIEDSFERYNLAIRKRAKKFLQSYNWNIDKALENLEKFK